MNPTTPAGSSAWSVVALALTGERLAAPSETPLDVDALVGWLDDQGWTSARLVEHRHHCQHEGRTWPHAVDAEMRGSLGAAQFHSLLAQVRAATGTSGLMPARREGPPMLGADDRRLLAERPPHHLG